jgi:hypothetical protein
MQLRQIQNVIVEALFGVEDSCKPQRLRQIQNIIVEALFCDEDSNKLQLLCQSIHFDKMILILEKICCGDISSVMI